MYELEHEAEPQELLDDVERLTGSACFDCARQLCGHEVTCSIALGCKNAPRCLGCLARGLDQPVLELRDHLFTHLRRRPCYWRAWQTSSTREGRDANFPSCLWPNDAQAATVKGRTAVNDAGALQPVANATTWDAGHLACGDLVLALRQRLQSLPPRTSLRVVALDPAAVEDIPAWCRLTGHRLVSASHPEYLIERKGG